MKDLRARLLIGAEIVKRQRIAAILWGLLGVLTLLRDELVPAAYRDRWHILDVVTESPWWIWVICGLVLALLIALEGAYKTVTVRETTIADLNLQLEAALPRSPKLSEAAKELLLVAAIQDLNGKIVRPTSSLGPLIQSNRRTFNEGYDPRETARWEAALEELELAGYVREADYKRVVFKVTNEGYEVARALEAS